MLEEGHAHGKFGELSKACADSGRMGGSEQSALVVECGKEIKVKINSTYRKTCVHTLPWENKPYSGKYFSVVVAETM